MITKSQKLAITEKRNFRGNGISGMWLKGLEGYDYSVFVGTFPNEQSVATYYPKSGKHLVRDYCPTEVKEVLMELWATLGAVK